MNQRNKTRLLYLDLLRSLRQAAIRIDRQLADAEVQGTAYCPFCDHVLEVHYPPIVDAAVLDLEAMKQPIPDYYTQYSPFTDPGNCATHFDHLPADLPGIVRAIQGLIIPPCDYALASHELELHDIEDAGSGFRRMDDLIAKLLDINSAPLNLPRPPRQRLGLDSRSFAAMLVAVLRHHGIPARLRVGFEDYLAGDIYFAHRIAQVWDACQGKWFCVDAFVDPPHKTALNIKIDMLDLEEGISFSPAGAVWLNARNDHVNPESFGNDPEDTGFPAIRYALLHDFDALNKFEVLGDDAWAQLIDKPDDELSADDLRFLDEVARLTLNPDVNFAAMTALHANSDYGRRVRQTAIAFDL